MTMPEPATDEEFIGYKDAAKHVGLEKSTLQSYVHRGVGPKVARRVPDRGYNRPMFLKSELDRWMRERKGRGYRSDLAHAGVGEACGPCAGPCALAT